MFKELGEFIDNVGRVTGYAVKRLLSDNEPLEMTGIGPIDDPIDDPIDEDLPKGLKEELENQEAVIVIDDTKNKDDV